MHADCALISHKIAASLDSHLLMLMYSMQLCTIQQNQTDISAIFVSCRYDFRRPQITAAPARITYGKEFTVTFSAPSRKDPFELHMASAPYTTHAYSQGQRLLILQVSDPVPVQQAGAGAAGASRFTVTVTAPPNANVAPPQYYMLFPMQAGTPGNAVWIQMVY